MKKIFKQKKGITLIALVITIIVLLILAGISISMLSGDKSILKKAAEARESTEKIQIIEQAKLDILAKLADKKGANLTDEEIRAILGTYFTSDTIPTDLSDLTQELTTKNGGYTVMLSEILSEDAVLGGSSNLADGSWNDSEGVNTPKLVAGLMPVKFGSNGSVIEVQSTDYANWYDYENKEWANAVTKDSNNNITGYWVWIPRFEYKINTSTQTTTVKFIPISTTEANKDSGFDHVHPAFCNGSNSHFMNGEWDTDLPGFWVAKFPAGYQQNSITDTNGTLSTTIQNSTDTLILSNQNYTKTNSYTTVPVGTISTDTKMSLPVFLPLTYAYNCICIGDSYTLSQEISKSSSFYGLSESSYSHMLKNSEWGAIAYLTQSQYGRNGTEPNINNYFTRTSSPYRGALTGVYATGTTTSSTKTLGSAWYTDTGKLGSSTENETGVYDLNGCVWEMVAGYITNGNANLTNYKGSLNWVTTTTNADEYLTLSNKYYTVYPYNSRNNSNVNNWTVYNGLKSSTYGYGDAVLETSTSGVGLNSWYSDYSNFAYTSSPFFIRGGNYGFTSSAGAFCFSNTSGDQDTSDGFRAVLCP